ncbi:hypothetical protein ACRTDR_14405 [Shewanella algae]|uniref:hypothetical protein n=1 Tax=Shewanella carassii TaxID=1987584 RepID=UPI001C7E7F34|nr:hypothetical protein [Shewanella carassii]
MRAIQLLAEINHTNFGVLMSNENKDYKLYGWLILILISVLVGVFIDFQGNNYAVTYESVEVATGPNKTEQKTVVVVPAAVQIYKLIANFFYGLAVALFATIFVARKLEQDQKEKHEKELEKLREAVNINVFDALFKTLIPKEIFQIVKTEIIENKAIRKKAHWTFVFSEESGKIKMTATTHYELHNVSKEPVSDPVKISMEPLSSGNQEIKKAQCLSSDGTALIEYHPSDVSNNKNIKIDDLENGGKLVSYTVTVPSNDYIESTFEYSTIFSDKVYDCQHTKYPIIDLNINAVFPKGYRFTVYPSLSNELKTISEGDTHKNFKVEGGVLPRQGIIYTLEKIS